MTRIMIVMFDAIASFFVNEDIATNVLLLLTFGY